MKAIRRRVPQRTVSGRHKWISRYPHRRFTSPEATHTQRHIAQTVAAVPWTDVSTAVRLAPDMRLAISREYCF